MTVARPRLPDVVRPVRAKEGDWPRVIEQINSNFRKLVESLYKIDLATDVTVADLLLRMGDAETSITDLGDTVTVIGTPAAGGGGGAGVPIKEIKTNTVTVTLAGATTTASAVVPAESALFGIYVSITGMTGASSLDAGVTNDPDQFGRNLTAIGGIAEFTFHSPHWVYGTALDVLLTANGGNFTGGTAVVTGRYWQNV